MPGDFGSFGEVSKAELSVLLIATAFLALVGFVDDVVGTRRKKVQGEGLACSVIGRKGSQRTVRLKRFGI